MNDKTNWLVDINKISELTCMSKRWLESELLKDPRFKSIEIKKNRKRLWPYQEAFELVLEISSEWKRDD